MPVERGGTLQLLLRGPEIRKGILCLSKRVETFKVVSGAGVKGYRLWKALL